MGDFFRVPRLPEKGLGLRRVRTRLKVSPCMAASHVSTVYPAENALFPLVHDERCHFWSHINCCCFKFSNFCLTLTVNWPFWRMFFGKSPEWSFMQEILLHMQETRYLCSNVGDLAGLLVTVLQLPGKFESRAPVLVAYFVTILVAVSRPSTFFTVLYELMQRTNNLGLK